MNKYSRQIGAFGMEAMSKLIQLKVRTESGRAVVLLILRLRTAYPISLLFTHHTIHIHQTPPTQHNRC